MGSHVINDIITARRQNEGEKKKEEERKEGRSEP